jgi:excisionase family DNA binding protein
MEKKFQSEMNEKEKRKGKNKELGAWGEERSDRRKVAALDAGCRRDFERDDLGCVEQPEARLSRKTRGQGQIFENLTWLNANEAAEYLRLPSVGMLRVLVCKREVPFHKWGRRLRFRKLELDRLIEASRNGGVRYGDQ